jgi:hypothetical protein
MKMEEDLRGRHRLEDMLNIDVQLLCQEFNFLVRLLQQNPANENLLRLCISLSNQLEEKCQKFENLLKSFAETVEAVVQGNLDPNIPDFHILDS